MRKQIAKAGDVNHLPKKPHKNSNKCLRELKEQQQAAGTMRNVYPESRDSRLAQVLTRPINAPQFQPSSNRSREIFPLHLNRIESRTQHASPNRPIEPSIVEFAITAKMGFFDSFSDLLEAALPWSTAEAEAQKEEEEEDAKVCLFYVLGGTNGWNWAADLGRE